MKRITCRPLGAVKFDMHFDSSMTDQELFELSRHTREVLVSAADKLTMLTEELGRRLHQPDDGVIHDDESGRE